MLPDPAGHAESGSHHRVLAVGLDDGRAVSGPLHRSAALLRRGERVSRLAHSDDLARHKLINAVDDIVQTFQPQLSDLQQQVLDLLHIPASVYNQI